MPAVWSAATMWSLTMYDVPILKVEIDRMISSLIKKWLRAPQCLSVALYGKRILKLLIASLTGV